ncbi:hypothetical protein KCU69_g13063, partial [Aureobasidium melanogenum]
CKTVHLIGSWDSYKSQLPLSKDSAKQGGWKGTFRFQGSTLKPGSRYWYYYIIDGYHVSHDPARESTTEPTTGRKLNILDIPSGKSSTAPAAPTPSSKSHSSHSSSKHTRRTSEHIPKGRSLSPSQIKCPRPNRPHETRAITHERYNASSVDRLANRLGNTALESDSEDSDSDTDSDVPSLTSSRSSASSSPSSTSASSRSSSASACTCNRYGITRSGARVKLDCGGDVCGYDEGSDCSSESEDEKQYRARTTRRQGMIVRR